MKKRKLVIVTGGTRGIGLAITRELLRRGYDVHILAQQENALKQVKSDLQQYGKVDYSVINLSDRGQIKNFSSQWSKSIWGLVNNAGCWAEERLDDPDTGIWDNIMKLNLEGLYFLTKGLQSWIVNGGRIINISSQLGTTGRVGMGIYSASKHAIIGLTRCWALELGNRTITANAICPGWVNTESNIKEIAQWAETEKISFNKKMKQLADPLPLHRFIEPNEVADLVAFLIDPSASGITGQAYEIK